MDLKLKNKNALVCASSEGIGKGIALGLAKEGANISILGRREDILQKTKKDIEDQFGVKVVATVCDLGKIADRDLVVEKTRTELGGIDILINNQGGPTPGVFEQINREQTEVAIETNLYSILQLSKACLEDMKIKKWGRIVNILSMSAKEPIPGMFLSNVIRPAVLGFAKSIAHDYAALGITVNSLLPSAVLSDRTNFFIEKAAKSKGITFDEELASISNSLPMKHIASPEEFAQMAVFLCSENASYITGAAICVDGGTSKGLY